MEIGSSVFRCGTWNLYKSIRTTSHIYEYVWRFTWDRSSSERGQLTIRRIISPASVHIRGNNFSHERAASVVTRPLRFISKPAVKVVLSWKISWNSHVKMTILWNFTKNNHVYNIHNGVSHGIWLMPTVCPYTIIRYL